MLRKALEKNYDRLDVVLAAMEPNSKNGNKLKGEETMNTMTMTKMTLKTEGDTHIVVTRHFAAPPEAVYRAHTDPKLIQQWLLGPEGWSMPVCINDARAGGKFRYEWSNGKQAGISHHGRISGSRTLQQNRSCRAHVPARPHARQSC